ncbi:MAG: hypothetical protein IJL05_02455 [Alphaproteobacteria bacterium]|nr:hypothetical protein [Alphaproteobacteria bacterium]
MQLNQKQIQEIIKYNPQRMYFGNWSETVLNAVQQEVLRNSKPQRLYIGDLTNDIICNALWYEMSYNPAYGDISPFIYDNKNDIVHFDNTYKQKMAYQTKDFLRNEIVNLTWNISAFIENLKKTGFYDNFIETGELPKFIDISGAKTLTYNIVCLDKKHRILDSLNKAIQSIANQNCCDFCDYRYKEQIEKIVMRRHPSGRRSDISYMMLSTFNQTTK